MTPSSPDIPLHDIMPLMEVPDNSFGFLVVVLLVVTVLALGGAYLFYHYFAQQKKSNQRAKQYTALTKVNFKTSKKAAYEITKFGRLFSEDSERLQAAYQNLVEQLEPYKYKKEVGEIDSETRSYYKIYLGMIDV